MKRMEVIALVLTGLVFVYLVGYRDGSRTRHHMVEQAAGVSP